MKNERIKSLEREVELLKQIVELQSKMLEWEHNQQRIPYPWTYPKYLPYVVYSDNTSGDKQWTL